MSSDIFCGCIPALMTPCDQDGNPNHDALVATGKGLVEAGMRGVVYCGSMGDWPLLSDAQRQEGVKRLTEAGVPVVVGTGAQNPALAAAREVWVLASGEGKKEALQASLEPTGNTPLARVLQSRSNTEIFTDFVLA